MDAFNRSTDDMDRMLDQELAKVTAQRQQLLDDSPTKSEMNQFTDFTQGFDHNDSPSIERGMGMHPGMHSRLNAMMPTLSSVSSLSASTITQRKALSDSGRRSSSNRFSPLVTNIRKETALGHHDSESIDYSPQKTYQRTPHNKAFDSVRRISPKSFKNTAELFNDLGLDPKATGATRRRPAESTQQSFRLPEDMPDLTAMLASARKGKQHSVHRAIESVPVSNDNQKLFIALQDLQVSVESLERRNASKDGQLQAARDALKKLQEQLETERQRATFAENELKQLVSSDAVNNVANTSRVDSGRIKALEAQTQRLQNTINSLEEESKAGKLQLQLAQEELKATEEERDEAVKRLAEAFSNIDKLTAECDSLRRELMQAQAKFVAEREAVVEPELKSAVDRVNARVQKAKVQKDEEARSFVDEAIELSRSTVLEDSEIEEISREIIERRKAKQARQANRQQPLQTKHSKVLPTQRHRQSKNAKGSQARPKRSLRSVSEAEEDEFEQGSDAFDLDFAHDVESEAEHSSEADYSSDVESLVTNDDEPSQILYRRMPARHRRSTTAKQHRPQRQHEGPRTKLDVQRMIAELGKHDMARCTICSKRQQARTTAHIQAKSRPTTSRPMSGHGAARPVLQQPAPYNYHTQSSDLVYEHDQIPRSYDPADATVRPSQPGQQALSSVLAALEDEFRHLRLKYADACAALKHAEPAVSKKARKQAADTVRSAIAAMEAKADQIYDVVDAIEANEPGTVLGHTPSGEAYRLDTERGVPLARTSSFPGAFTPVDAGRPWLE
ncbi:hypothetical protein PYCC9005_004373 [Savitreella phatthalungensis]